MKIRMIEARDECSDISIGCSYVIESIKKHGFDVKYITNDDDDDDEYDIELISVSHAVYFPKVLSIKKRGKIRIIGGHHMQSNPRPMIHHADVVCIGEAETWIKLALNKLKENFSIDSLKDLKGTIISKYWRDGDDIPALNYEVTVPDNAPILSKKTLGHSATWYIEIGRGCPFSCYFCELGHSSKARMRNLDSVKRAVDLCDKNLSKKITFFAPDEASHRHYPEILEYIYKKGFSTQFGSMRLDQILRKKNIPFKANMLIRVGIDGLTEKIRERVNKKMSNQTIIDYFYYMFENGHVNFKIFQIFSYSFETLEDFEEWEQLFYCLQQYPFKKNVMFRVKFTPFMPQVGTPMANEKLTYNVEMRDKILKWFDKNKNTQRGKKGINLTSDGIMSVKKHLKAYDLVNGNENIDLKRYDNKDRK